MLATIDFSDFFASCYLYVKAFHILVVIAWMAGLLYLPRLFVYHAENAGKREITTIFLTMERRLLRIIMLPSMIATFLSGGFLLAVPGVVQWSSGWIHLKILSVLMLAALHGMMVSWWRDFEIERNKKSSVFFRLINEVPFAIAIVIVFLVVLKPF